MTTHAERIEQLQAYQQSGAPFDEAFEKAFADVVDSEKARAAAIAQGLADGAKGRQLTRQQVEGIESLVDGMFVGHRFDNPTTSEEQNLVRQLVENIASDPLLTKLIGAWHTEGDVFDWPDNPNGVLGRAVDSALEVLSTYPKGNQE